MVGIVRRKIALRVLFGILILFIISIIGGIGFIAYWGWSIRDSERQLDDSIQGSWTPFTRWEIMDAAIKEYGCGGFDLNNFHLNVPLSASAQWYDIQTDQITIEYGGGFHHCGIFYFPNPNKLKVEDGPDMHEKKLNDRVVFYSER